MSLVRSRVDDVALLGISIAGLTIFIAPLVLGSTLPQNEVLFTALIACAALAVMAMALQTHRLSTRLLAVLAALVAVDATLRLVIVVGLLGFSPIFFLIIVGGYVMGPSFGFALGSLTLLLSAVLTAGFGPWLPYQMLASGWVGMGAGYLGRLRFGLIPLAIYGCAAGFAYGILLDLWEWPFLLGAASPISWAPHLAWPDLVRRFAAFYLTTSLVYDAFRAAGNLVLLLLLGAPVAAALRRFRRRFLVQWQPAAAEIAPVNISEDVRTPA
ncbi:MAG TPA: ECF transporter S component [Candidatus Dormibacteraeota bacterium]|nr:ECF transporter S component [Candidatus Dormibacteraeota bacterium]